MPVVKGDTVRVVRGDDKGKEGKVLRVLPQDGARDGRGREHREEAPQGAHGAEEQSGIIEIPGADPRTRT